MNSLNHLRRTLVIASLAAGTFGILLPSATLADGKGASKLMKSDTVSATNQAVAGKPAAMTCPYCKDVFVTVPERSSKGGQLASMHSVAKHLCPACSTKITTVGVGKAKTDRVDHTCGDSAGSKSSCCTASM